MKVEIAIVGVALAMSASAAGAEVLEFSYVETGPGAIDFTFDQLSDPTPVSYLLTESTTISVSDWSGDIGPYSTIAWLNSRAFKGFETTDESFAFTGPAVFGGSDSAPTFAPGVFDFLDDANGLSGVLTITAISSPEPVAWLLMLAGFAGLGAALRRRRQAFPVGSLRSRSGV